jgi:hypothetical protein
MEYGDVNLSLLKNPTLVFDNTIGASKENINTPLTYKEDVIGWVTDITEKNIYCRVFDKFIRFLPEFNSKDGIEKFKLYSINILLPVYEINKQLETENYVAVEMYKQFMKDNVKECSKVRKQILKHQEVDYFKKTIK